MDRKKGRLHLQLPFASDLVGYCQATYICICLHVKSESRLVHRCCFKLSLTWLCICDWLPGALFADALGLSDGAWDFPAKLR